MLTMWSGARLTLVLGAMIPCATIFAQDAAPVRLLFLGDRGHHRPAERVAQLKPVLERRGIAVTYTETLDDLNPKTLAGYDCLLIYANFDQLGPEQEKALIGFVAGGKGLVPIHCASYCFRNSDAYVQMVGAQFQRHGTGTFRTEIIDRDHAVTRGFMAFESWDETYVHHRHVEDRHVLSCRVEGEHREPWTWVREHDKGRVFYTAWGHDQRTWAHPGFHDLVERGVRWAAGDRFVLPVRRPKPFSYRPATIPDYRPDRRNDSPHRKTMQEPLPPEDSMTHHLVPSGVHLELFASEPEIVNPVAMAWDARGRLWIAETVDYPNDRQPAGKGHDRIKICEDTDGDGRADRFTVFADGLSIPTSLVFARGGVIVHQPPVTLLLRDTDGDDRADERDVLLSGWGTGDTHAGPSSLRMGLDNQVWGTVGYSAFNGTIGTERRSFRQGVYRFLPDGSSLEFLGSTSNNTWGLGIGEAGEVFCSTANNDQCNYLAIPNRYYESVTGWHGRGLAFIADYRALHPITDKVRQVDWHGRYTAAAGCALYTARSFPASYWNRVALINSPTGHLLHLSRLEREGSGFVARDGYNAFASRDEWCAPTFAEVGPDGAIWMVDWYSYIVQHNPTPHGFETGSGNAYVTPHRDKGHARIYRLVWEDAKVPASLDLTRAAPTELVATLRNDNMLWRLHAQRLLVERGRTDVLPALLQLIADRTLDGIGSTPGAIHALWTLHGLGVLDGGDGAAPAAARAALGHPAQAVRANALRVLPRDAVSRDALLSSGVLDDGDLLVRREALLALADMPASAGAGVAVFDRLRRRENAADRWIPDAATVAAARHDAGFLRAVLARTRVASSRPVVPPAPENLLPNPSFEDRSEDASQGPVRWRPRTYSGRAQLRLARGGRTGDWCLEISSTAGADTSWFVDVDVKRNTRYRLSGWVRTESIRNLEGAYGALMNVHVMPARTITGAVAGTGGWQEVGCEFDTGNRDRVSINCLFGGWGRSRGTAWFDDVSLLELGQSNALASLPHVLGDVVRNVTRHYASRGPVESVIGTLTALAEADEGLAAYVLQGIASGWPSGKAPDLGPAKQRQLAALMKVLPFDQRVQLVSITDRWGRRDLFVDEILALRQELGRILAGPESETTARIGAARHLLRIDDGPAAVKTILTEIKPETPPEVGRGLVNTLADSASPTTGPALLDHWSSFKADIRADAVSALLRRRVWTIALLDALESGRVPRTDLSAAHWQQMRLSVDGATARRIEIIERSRPGFTNATREAVLERLLPVVATPGDPARGRQVFRTLCSSCHTFNGVGGKMAPSLEGVGARSKQDLLTEIVDPNRSLESTYRLWMVFTKDDEIFTGRLLSETRTTIELIDSGDQHHRVNRSDIDVMRASKVSAMPEGIVDGLPRDDLRALITYLRTHGQKR